MYTWNACLCVFANQVCNHLSACWVGIAAILLEVADPADGDQLLSLGVRDTHTHACARSVIYHRVMTFCARVWMNVLTSKLRHIS